MNAKLLERLVAYREARGLEVAKLLLSQKIRLQFSLLGSVADSAEFNEQLVKAQTMRALLLVEARAARAYWKRFGKSVAARVSWTSRMPRAEDPCNQALDVGYHYLAQRVVKWCAELNIPTELGFFHKAQSAHAHPFVYDFMEWMRPLVVDKAMRVFFKKKKKRVEHITKRHIGHLLGVIKKGLERRYYHRRLGYCITLAYWSKLILLEFEKCVRRNEPFRPIFPSLRHETRCGSIKSRPANLQGDKIAVD